MRTPNYLSHSLALSVAASGIPDTRLFFQPVPAHSLRKFGTTWPVDNTAAAVGTFVGGAEGPVDKNLAVGNAAVAAAGNSPGHQRVDFGTVGHSEANFAADFRDFPNRALANPERAHSRDLKESFAAASERGVCDPAV